MKFFCVSYIFCILYCSARCEEIVLRAVDPTQIQELIFMPNGMMLDIVCNKYPHLQSTNGDIIAFTVFKWEAVGEDLKYTDKEGKARVARKSIFNDETVYFMGEAMFRMANKSLIYAKLNELRHGKFPKPDKPIETEWGLFDKDKF